MKRILAFILVFAMLFTLMATSVYAADADGKANTINEDAYYDTKQQPSLKITEANVQFASTVYLLIAVNYGNAGINYDINACVPKAEIKVDVTNKAGVTTTLEIDTTIEHPSHLAKDSYALFKYTDLSAKEMADTLTIRAYTADKSNSNRDVADHTIEYSVLEYTIKANAAKADAKLLNALDKMLAFGAAAQEAFEYEGDYALADENGVIDYGMVLVGGAATRKVIAPVGADVNPTADSKTFKSAAKLYDMSFNEVAPSTLKVADGISRYFYYGVDVSGNNERFLNNDGSVNSEAPSTPNTRNLNNLNFANLDSGVPGTEKTIGKLTTFRQQLSNSSILTTGTSLSLSGSYSWYAWAIRTHTGAKGTESTGTLKIDNGYMYIQTNDYASLYNNSTTSTYAMADAENKVTVTVALALSADYTGTVIRAGFYDAQSSNSNDRGAVYGLSGVPRADIFNVDKDGILYVGEYQSYSSKVAELKKVDGEWSADDVTIVHFVVDMNRETVTAYTADGNSKMVTETMAGNFFSDKKDSYVPIMDDIFNLEIKGGAAYISRVTISSGDLFN